MRNLVGGILGAVVGASLVSYLIAPTPSVYPNPFSEVWFILDGSRILQVTYDTVLTNGQVLEVIATWFIIGVILVPFSKTESNSIRTALWVGIVLATFSVVSNILTDVGFWDNPERNILLLGIYIHTVIVSLLALITTVPLVWIGKKIRKQKDVVCPSRIETTCECGAVVKSRPIMCAECGKILIQLAALSTDSAP